MTLEDKSIGKILIIDDDEDVLLAAKLLLKKHAHQVITEKNPKKIPFLLNNDSYDVILLDMNFSKDITSGKEGFYWLHQIIEHDPNAVVILITAFGDVEMAVRALKEGATDFVLKPWQNEKLLATISTAIKLKKSYQEVDQLKKAKRQLEDDLNQPFLDVLGISDAMRQVTDLINKVSETDANVLILGENGTGKELIARAIHQKSERREGVFVTADLTSINKKQFNQELYGYHKEALPEAKEDKQGKLELADKGTLYLHEVGNLNPDLQTQLLSNLEAGSFQRMGETNSVNVDVRIIGSSSLAIHDLVAHNKFRQDLLFKINTVEIIIPPLRERVSDIEPIAYHYLKTYNRKYRKNIKSIGQDALDSLKNYPWPGNLVELEHTIERVVITTENEVLSSEDFFFLNQDKETEEAQDPNVFNLEEVEKNVIQKAIQKHNGNISKAASELGLTRASLYRRLEKYGL